MVEGKREERREGKSADDTVFKLESMRVKGLQSVFTLYCLYVSFLSDVLYLTSVYKKRLNIRGFLGVFPFL